MKNLTAAEIKTKYFSTSNVTEATDEFFNDLDAMITETTIEEDVTELNNLEKVQPAYKIDGVLNPVYTDWVKENTAAKIAFQNKYGVTALTIFNTNKTLKTRITNIKAGRNKLSTSRLQNSKGNGYGNL